MKKQSAVMRQIIIIFVIGLIMSTILGDFNLGGLFSGTGGMELKALFDTMSTIFAVVAILLGVGYLVYRSAQVDLDGVWTEWEDDGES
jgi:hypothetical protein